MKSLVIGMSYNLTKFETKEDVCRHLLTQNVIPTSDNVHFYSSLLDNVNVENTEMFDQYLASQPHMSGTTYTRFLAQQVASESNEQSSNQYALVASALHSLDNSVVNLFFKDVCNYMHQHMQASIPSGCCINKNLSSSLKQTLNNVLAKPISTLCVISEKQWDSLDSAQRHKIKTERNTEETQLCVSKPVGSKDLSTNAQFRNLLLNVYDDNPSEYLLQGKFNVHPNATDTNSATIYVKNNSSINFEFCGLDNISFDSCDKLWTFTLQ